MKNIDGLSKVELNIAVAEELGYNVYKDESGYWLISEQEANIYLCNCDLPFYSADIATAWGLDGEGWEWSSDDVVLFDYPQMFGTNDKIMEVSVRVGDEFFNGFAPWKTIEDKQSAYATARCRAWLKARYALKGK